MKREDGKVIFQSWTDCDFHTYQFFLPFLLAAMKYFCEKTGGWSPVHPRQFFSPKEFKIIIFLFYYAFSLKKGGCGQDRILPTP